MSKSYMFKKSHFPDKAYYSVIQFIKLISLQERERERERERESPENHFETCFSAFRATSSLPPMDAEVHEA